MDASFRPLPGRFGTMPDGRLHAFPSIGNNTTTLINLTPSPHPQYFNEAWVNQQALGTFAGTGTVQIQKWDNTASATVNLTAAVDLTSATQTAKATYVIPALTTVTDAQRTIHPDLGDALYAAFVTNNTVSAQPTAGGIGVETYLLK